MPILDTDSKNNLERKLISDIVLQLLAFVADKERQTTLERQRQGINAMPYGDELTRNGQRKKVNSRTNKPIGRPQIAFPEKLEIFHDKWKNGEITAKCCMQHLGLKRSTFYKLAKIFDEKS